MSRFILYRVAEQLEVEITLHPKPFKNLNGQGNHLNFSTLESRNNAIKAKLNQANNCCEIIK
jgi:glutamine synthetase